MTGLTYLNIDNVKSRETVYVTSDYAHLRAKWTECELGRMTDEDLKGYCGCPGIVTEIEDDDDTVQLEWITMDTQWIPVEACCRDLPKADKRDAPISFIPRLNGEGAENMEGEISAKQASSYQPPEGDYLTIDGVKAREKVYVTNDLTKLRKEWGAAELGRISDEDLSAYCGCPGTITEIEEDDDTLQLEWITMDTQWIPVAACVRNLPDACKKDAPASFIPRFNGEGAENMADEISAKQASSYVPPEGDYLSIDKVKNNETVYVTNDLARLKKEWAEAELGNLSDADLRAYCGCPGKITEVEDDDDTVQLEWITMDTQWIPVAACVRNLPDACKCDAPVSFIPRLNGETADNMEDEIAAKDAARAQE